MNRFEQVIRILDNAVGGPTSPVGFHGAFWRGSSRDEFVKRKIVGLPLIEVGNGAGSNLVRALKGVAPFGADTGDPDADFNRMPSGMPPVASADIAFIEKWIDDGCPETETAPAPPVLTWKRTNAPTASSRTDDIWFLDPLHGWAVNSDGNILETTDGGQSWDPRFSAPNVYLRCVGFANTSTGWVGTLSRNRRLFNTVDGGRTWTVVTPLPANAPVAVCGLSVVSDKIVYASGTNRPNDFPRMMKTVDGGATWTAWDMSAHASILIDTFFTSALHGWVVGGKASEPTPTTRGKLKPVVLETNDGGATWINRLAGQEAEFPFGEWGWKIQFLNERIGFVSLENFTAAAILKTEDGGKTWRRIVVQDPQGNVNLEGIGFVDEQKGWVGGWGPGGFGSGGDPTGLSSSTVDGGKTWSDANEIGRFLNRFRFFGKPVHTGYASGDTVYKYSAEPVPAPSPVAAFTRSRALLPDEHITAAAEQISIRMQVPPATKRLTLHAWTRFGEEVGCILDEIHPVPGPRAFLWDGTDSLGTQTEPGDYVVRMIADDVAASSLLRVLPPRPGGMLAAAAIRRAPRRYKHAPPSPPKLTTLAALVQAPVHDIDWLRNALQIAIQLELATLPPYLTARWTIRSQSDPVARSIKVIRREEMTHFGLACNLLTSIGGTPLIADNAVVPKYPGPLPGGVRPGLTVSLRKLDAAQARVFMEIERPQGEPIGAALVAPPTTIGEFYSSILEAFRRLNPALSADRQITAFGLTKAESLEEVAAIIESINLQGEGSAVSPEEKPGDLAHYYRFGEIYHQRSFVKDAAGKWGFHGDPVPLPEVYPMADIPEGGYHPGPSEPVVKELIERFDREYSEMLRLLELAWKMGDGSRLGDSVGKMTEMGMTADELIREPRPDGNGNYGPCFRYVGG